MFFVQIALKSLLEPSKVPVLGLYLNCPSPPASATAPEIAVVPKYPLPKFRLNIFVSLAPELLPNAGL